MSDILDTIAKLLAKAEGTDNEHEQNAFFEKAQALMTKHAIDSAMLSKRTGVKEEIVFETVTVGSARADQLLFNVVSASRDMKCIAFTGEKKYERITRMQIVGYRDDIEYAKTLYASLLIQRERALSLADKPAREHGRTFNASFRLGYAARINARLQEIKQRTERDVTVTAPGTDIVLRSRAKDIENAFAVKYPRIRQRSNVHSRSASGRTQGDIAGQRADISNGAGNLGASTGRELGR